MAEQIRLVSAAAVYKKDGDDVLWFLIKEKEGGGWEIPKTVTKNGESSVRASIRALGEQGGMRVKVLEEVGRHLLITRERVLLSSCRSMTRCSLAPIEDPPNPTPAPDFTPFA